jgi:DNA polymerase-3 subunit delta
VSPEEAIERARTSEPLPVYLVVGEEEFLRDRCVRALKEAVLTGGIPGLNEDAFVAGEASVDQVLGVTRTMPMMARRRFVLVRAVERWVSEKRGEGDAEKSKGKASRSADALERLAEYASAPVQGSVLVLVATKIDARKRLMTAAKNGGFLVTCDPLPRPKLPGFIEQYAKSRGGRLEPGVSELVAELTGPELSSVADAVERLCLYAGERAVTEEDVSACLVRLRARSVWELVDAIGRRELASALRALEEALDEDDRGEPLRLLGLLALSARQILRFEAALRGGAAPAEAAAAARVPPFKARDLAEQVKRLSRSELEAWLVTLSRLDLELKGGSRRPSRAILEHAVIEACRSVPRRPGAGWGGA